MKNQKIHKTEIRLPNLVAMHGHVGHFSASVGESARSAWRTSGRRGAPTMRWRSTPSASSTSKVGVRVIPSSLTRSRRWAASISMWVTPLDVALTSPSTFAVTRHGAHTSEENWTNVAASPMGRPSRAASSPPAVAGAARRRPSSARRSSRSESSDWLVYLLGSDGCWQDGDC